MSQHAFDDQVVIPSLMRLLKPLSQDEAVAYFDAPSIELDRYDQIVVCISGGKDSIACLLALIEAGADMRRVELWHHDVDGHEGSQLMDWLFMRDYVRQLAAAFHLPLYFSWLEGGLEAEMLKQNAYSRPHKVETPDGLITLARDHRRSQPGTRMRFPQQSASLSTRWCSSAAKIDVGRRALNNQDRFRGTKTLFVTGERREESHNRAKYNQFEPHHCDRRAGSSARHVDAWRPVLHWSEEQVWAIIARHRVLAPVPYRLGWSRSSCMTCIYNGPRIWATINRYFPQRAQTIAGYEDRFGVTISRQRLNVIDLGATAQPFEIHDLAALEQAGQVDYRLPVLAPQGEVWVMPPGAFGSEGCGAV
jgi:3'-phosphoadenosine 5'-phosphosulfate sulfotransferase (PAPS reductase)/FAD synthetase